MIWRKRKKEDHNWKITFTKVSGGNPKKRKNLFLRTLDKLKFWRTK